MPTIEQAVKGYIRMRDRKEAIQKKHKEELRPLLDNMEKVEAWVLKQLQDQGADNIKTAEGTAYIVHRNSVVAKDKQAFIEYVQEHDMHGLLDIRPNKTAVLEFVESTGDIPPGVSLTTQLVANIRR
jgi:hypothetical protein